MKSHHPVHTNVSPILFLQFSFLQDHREGIDIYRSFCAKLINFTVAHAILMDVNAFRTFSVITCIPIVYGTHGGEERCIWS